MLKSPDATARSTHFQREVKDRRPYEAWLASPGLSKSQPEELLIAWQLAKIVGLTPTNVVRALRGQSGVPAGVVERLQRIVEANDSIEFRIDEDGVKRTVFTERAESATPPLAATGTNDGPGNASHQEL